MLTTLTRTSPLPSDSPTLRVVIADGLTMSRITLRSVLARNGGCAIVGETFDGAGAVKLVLDQRPHVLVLDLAMPRVLDALRQLRDSDTGVRPVVVAAAIRSQAVATALALGARGVLRKNVRPSVLSACVRTVAQGGYWIGEGRVEDVVDAFDRVRVGTSPLSGDALRCQS
jgi:DNA-binding NarL/FixJ family response regulator